MMEHFRLMAQYNQWANRRIYRTCRYLSENDYLATRPMFFGSIHACLNHILLVDQMWKARCQGREFRPASLDQVLYPDLSTLTAARTVEDDHLIRWVEETPNEALKTQVTYHSVTKPDQVQSRPLWEIFSHLFVHQTHHRGQVHGQLAGTYAQPPELDLIYFLIDRENGIEG